MDAEKERQKTREDRGKFLRLFFLSRQIVHRKTTLRWKEGALTFTHIIIRKQLHRKLFAIFARERFSRPDAKKQSCYVRSRATATDFVDHVELLKRTSELRNRGIVSLSLSLKSVSSMWVEVADAERASSPSQWRPTISQALLGKRAPRGSM